MKAKAKVAEADAKIELNNQLESLEKRLTEAQGLLAEYADAGEEAWESLKLKMEQSLKTVTPPF